MLEIPIGVFHPGLFFSSKFMSEYIIKQDLRGKKILDIGCGSGILSLIAAKAGGEVHAIDINPDAIRATKNNSKLNELNVFVYQSDLFDQVTEQFDIILINPPYFPREPRGNPDKAWYCGEKFEYFIKLFAQISQQSKHQTVLMVLSDKCDIEKIVKLSNQHYLSFLAISEKNYLIEKNIIYSIKIQDEMNEHKDLLRSV